MNVTKLRNLQSAACNRKLWLESRCHPGGIPGHRGGIAPAVGTDNAHGLAFWGCFVFLRACKGTKTGILARVNRVFREFST